MQEGVCQIVGNGKNERMRITVVGLNQKSAPVGIRERLAFDARSALTALKELRTRFRQGEFALLSTFVRNQGIVLSREKLLEDVWGFDYYGESRTVDVHVNHLREKLGGAGVRIETIRGTGYKITAGDETE